MITRILTYKTLRIVTLTVALCLACFTGQAQGNTWYPNTVAVVTRLIQDGNLSLRALNGDTLQLPPGVIETFGSTLNIRVGLVIRGSVDANGNPTTILRTSASSLFNIQTGANHDTVRIQNVIIQRTANQGGGGNISGGFINASGTNTKVVVENCRVTTRASNRGGAIYVSGGAHLIVRNSAFIGCHADGHGGVFAVEGTASRLWVYDSEMNDNTSDGHGGVFFVNQATVFVSGCDMYDNEIFPGANGGAAYLTGNATMTVEHSFIVGNRSKQGGAGFFLNGQNNLFLRFVTMVGNINTGNAEGAVGAPANSNVSIEGSVITGNNTAGGAFGNDLPNPNNINISNSVVGADFVVDSNTTIPSVVGPGDVVRCDSTGNLIVSIPTTIPGPGGTVITIPIPVDSNGNPTIGAGGGGHAGFNPVSLSVSINERAPCVNVPVTFTVITHNLTTGQVNNLNNVRYRLYLEGTPRVLLEERTGASQGATIHGIEFTISRPNVAFERFRVTLRYDTQDGNNPWREVIYDSQELFLIVLPDAPSEAIEHRTNIEETIDP